LNLPPPIKLDFIKKLTDETGIFQHAKFSIPNRKEGYTTDDNARALIAATKYYSANNGREIQKLIDIYLSFIYYMQRDDGRLNNFLGYDRKIVEVPDSEDCMGHTLWACGTCLNSSLDLNRKNFAREIFDRTFACSSTFKSLRAQALSIMGLQQYYQAYPEDKNTVLNVKSFADNLMSWYTVASSDEWKWFEAYVTYANARLPHALFAAYDMTGNKKYFQVAFESLNFLLKDQIVEDKFMPVGNKGWYMKGKERAFYDQQPVDAACMIDALHEAYRLTENMQYLKLIRTVFGWFLGNNSKNVMVYDVETGACHDGINLQGLNLNQGAESTVSYLLARLQIDELKM